MNLKHYIYTYVCVYGNLHNLTIITMPFLSYNIIYDLEDNMYQLVPKQTMGIYFYAADGLL